MRKRGVEVYPRSGTKSWFEAENGYPAQQHDGAFNQKEIEETYPQMQKYLERRYPYRNQKLTMMTWENVLTHTWKTRHIGSNYLPAPESYASNYLPAVGHYTNTKSELFIHTRNVVIIAQETWISNLYFTKSFSQRNEAHCRK